MTDEELAAVLEEQATHAVPRFDRRADYLARLVRLVRRAVEEGHDPRC